MIGTKLAHYEITSHLGSGGMGDVYQATDTKLNRSVAIKFLPEIFSQDTDRITRFQREARVLASLNHPNIAAIYGIEEIGGRSFLVMERVAGETLAERISRGPIPLDEALGIAAQIAEGLDAAHESEKGIIHRDLKPANVKITPDGKVKVLDFGLAKAIESAPADTLLSHSPTMSLGATGGHVIVGTAAYMAPEQARGKPLDRRADIWAFGVVLYEMVTGRKLFDGEDLTEIVASVVKLQPDLNAAPHEVRKLLESCLQKDPRKRLQSIADWKLALPDRDPRSENAPAPQPRRPVRLPWIAAVALAVLLAAVSFTHFRETPPALESIRFQILPPEKANIGVFRVSPDGRTLVFISGGRLWVRPLDTLEAKPLAGTEGASYPFWSPDGANIGFFHQGKLKRIALAGGPAVTLCEAVSGRGGAWNRDGVIIFSAGPTVPIERVSAAGGVPAPITKFASTDSAEGHRFPEFLPDGRHFLYLAQSAKIENSGVFIGSLEEMQPKRLMRDTSYVIYSPPVPGAKMGHLLFRREDTLMAQPFDTAELALAGDVFPVAEKVGNVANAGFGAFSVSENGALALGAGARASRLAYWFDRAGSRVGAALTEPGPVSVVELSPDKTKLVLSRGDNDTADVWIQDLVRATASRFTFTPGRNNAPVWSPDGSRVAYSFGDGTGTYLNNLIEKRASGDGKENILLKPAGLNAAPMDWSKDGKFIVYRVDGEKTNTDIWLLPLEGDRKPASFLQTPFIEGAARFSPDSKFLAYASNESGQTQVYVQPLARNGSKWQVSTDGGASPQWRADGKEIYYTSGTKLMAAPVTTGASFEQGKPQLLFETPATMSVYRPDGDGRRFLLVIAGDTEQTPVTIVTNWQAAVKK